MHISPARQKLAEVLPHEHPSALSSRRQHAGPDYLRLARPRGHARRADAVRRLCARGVGGNTQDPYSEILEEPEMHGILMRSLAELPGLLCRGAARPAQQTSWKEASRVTGCPLGGEEKVMLAGFFNQGNLSWEGVLDELGSYGWGKGRVVSSLAVGDGISWIWKRGIPWWLKPTLEGDDAARSWDLAYNGVVLLLVYAGLFHL